MQDVGLEVRHGENLREHHALAPAGRCRNLEGHRPGSRTDGRGSSGLTLRQTWSS